MDARRHGAVLLPLLALLVVVGCGGATKTSRASTPAGRTPAAAIAGGTAVDIGWSEPHEPYLGYLAFYPDQLSIHAGDTITFTNYTAHTLAFLPQGVTPPQFDVYGLGFAPISLGPCITQQPVGATTSQCPEATSAPGDAWPDFSGSGFYNTGLLTDKAVVRLRFSPATAPGDYRFVCLIHTGMEGEVHVVPAAQAVDTPAVLARTAQQEIAADSTAAHAAQQSVTAPPDGTTVRAGALVGASSTNPRVSLNTFYPGVLTVKAGTTVTWQIGSAEPHSVGFGKAPAPPDPATVGPPSQPAGSDYVSGSNAYTGLLNAAEPGFLTSFSLRFTTPGQYLYVCTLHQGMAGAINVTQ